MGNEKYHGGLNMFKSIETDIITHKQLSNIKTIEIDISEAEILKLINQIPKVYSLEDEEYHKAISLIKLVSKLSESWSKKQKTEQITK
jgi:Ca2+-binding EF-hand superfamily protein